MLVGILSDSHGRSTAVRLAMQTFDRLGVAHVFHCGDVGGMPVFDELAGRACTFVWGNTDFPDAGLIAYLQTLGLQPPGEPPALATAGEKRFAVFHGHEANFERALATLDVDYILHGHTHVPRDEHHRGKRIINPGALHRAKSKTVATLDTVSDELTYHTIVV